MRAAFAFLLTILGALLLGLAALDWTAIDVPAFETIYLESRLHSIHGDSFSDPWQPDYWWEAVRGDLAWLAIAIAGTLAAFTASWVAATRPRIAAILLASAIAGAAAIASLAAAAISTSRADDLVRTTLERQSGPRLRWLTPELFETSDLFWDRFSLTLAAMLLLLVLVPAIAWSWVRIVRRPAAIAAAVIATLAAVAVPFLRLRHFDEIIIDTHWLAIVHSLRYMLLGAAILCAVAVLPDVLRRDRSPLRPALVLAVLAFLAFLADIPIRGVDFSSTLALTGWQGTLDVLRLVLLGAALLCTVTLLPAAIRHGKSRLLPAVAVALLGAAAFTATAPHRHTNRTFYPIRDVGFFILPFHWLPDPGTLDPPRVHACTARGTPLQSVALRLDETGATVLDVSGARYRLPADSIAAREALDAVEDTGFRFETDPRHEVLLLVDRRVPATAVVDLLRLLPSDVDLVSVAGAFTQLLPSTVGPIETWTLWRFAVLRRDALLPPVSDGTHWGDVDTRDVRPFGVADDMTWGDIVDYPTSRYLLRDDPHPTLQIPAPG